MLDNFNEFDDDFDDNFGNVARQVGAPESDSDDGESSCSEFDMDAALAAANLGPGGLPIGNVAGRRPGKATSVSSIAKAAPGLKKKNKKGKKNKVLRKINAEDAHTQNNCMKRNNKLKRKKLKKSRDYVQ